MSYKLVELLEQVLNLIKVRITNTHLILEFDLKIASGFLAFWFTNVYILHFVQSYC